MQDTVFEELRRHLASADHVDLGQYRFINLEAVRAAAGPMWESLRSRVFLASESIIRKYAGESDLVIQCATGFLVVYRGSEPEEAQATTRAIGEALRRFFLGETMTRLMGLETSCEQLSVAEFAATLDAAQAEERASEGARAEVRQLAARRVIDPLQFGPVWDPRREAVASFMARPRRRREDGRGWVPASDLLCGRPGHEPRLELDLAVLALVREALSALQAGNARCGVITPVGYPALAHPGTRTRYATALAAIPEALRRLIVLKVEAAPLDAPAGQISENCRTLLPHCGRLVLHASLDALSLQRFENAGATLVGASLPASGSRSAIEHDLERFCALARRISLPVYLDAVADWEQLKIALASPVRLIAGPVFGERSELAVPYRLSRARALSSAA